MGRVSKKEKPKIVKDFQAMENNRKKGRKEFSADEYIKFLNFFNSFLGHKLKKAERMRGENFKL